MKLEKQHMIKMRNSNKMMAILKKKHTCLRNNNNNSPLGLCWYPTWSSVWAPIFYFLSSFLLMLVGKQQKQQKMAQARGPSHINGRQERSSWILISNWPAGVALVTICGGIPRDGKYIFLFSSPSFSANKIYFSKKKIKKKNKASHIKTGLKAIAVH